jgi:hypothetical protein
VLNLDRLILGRASLTPGLFHLFSLVTQSAVENLEVSLEFIDLHQLFGNEQRSAFKPDRAAIRITEEAAQDEHPQESGNHRREPFALLYLYACLGQANLLAARGADTHAVSGQILDPILRLASRANKRRRGFHEFRHRLDSPRAR